MSGDRLLYALDQLVERLASCVELAREVANLVRGSTTAAPAPSHPPIALVPNEGDAEAYGDFWTACLMRALPLMPRGPNLRKPSTLETLVRGLRKYMNDKTKTCTPPPSIDLGKELGISKDAVQAGISYLRATYWLQSPKDNKDRMGKGWRRLTYHLDVPPQYLPPGTRPTRARRGVPQEEAAPQLDLSHPLGPPGPDIAPGREQPVLDPPSERPGGAPAGGSAFYAGSMESGRDLAHAGTSSGPGHVDVRTEGGLLRVVADESGQQLDFAGLVPGYQTPFDSLTTGYHAPVLGLARDSGEHGQSGQHGGSGHEGQASSAGAAWNPGHVQGHAGTRSGQHLPTRAHAIAHVGAFPSEKHLKRILLLLRQNERARDQQQQYFSSEDQQQEKPSPAAVAQASMCLQTWEWLKLRLPDESAPDAEDVLGAWEDRVRDELLPLIIDEDDPAWRDKEGKLVPWEHRAHYWKKALQFLGRGTSFKDMDAALKYSVKRVDAPIPGTEHDVVHSTGHEGGRKVSAAAPTPAPGPHPVAEWRNANTAEVVQLEAAAAEQLGGAAAGLRIRLLVDQYIGDVVNGRTTVDEILAEADLRRSKREPPQQESE